MSNKIIVNCGQCSQFQEADTGVIGRCFVYQKQISNSDSLLGNSRMYQELGGLEFLTTKHRECEYFVGKYSFNGGDHA